MRPGSRDAGGRRSGLACRPLEPDEDKSASFLLARPHPRIHHRAARYYVESDVLAVEIAGAFEAPPSRAIFEDGLMRSSFAHAPRGPRRGRSRSGTRSQPGAWPRPDCGAVREVWLQSETAASSPTGSSRPLARTPCRRLPFPSLAISLGCPSHMASQCDVPDARLAPARIATRTVRDLRFDPARATVMRGL